MSKRERREKHKVYLNKRMKEGKTVSGPDRQRQWFHKRKKDLKWQLGGSQIQRDGKKSQKFPESKLLVKRVEGHRKVSGGLWPGAHKKSALLEDIQTVLPAEEETLKTP